MQLRNPRPPETCTERPTPDALEHVGRGKEKILRTRRSGSLPWMCLLVMSDAVNITAQIRTTPMDMPQTGEGPGRSSTQRTP